MRMMDSVVKGAIPELNLIRKLMIPGSALGVAGIVSDLENIVTVYRRKQL